MLPGLPHVKLIMSAARNGGGLSLCMANVPCPKRPKEWHTYAPLTAVQTSLILDLMLPPRLLTLAELATLYGVPEDRIRQWCEAGKLPAEHHDGLGWCAWTDAIEARLRAAPPSMLPPTLRDDDDPF